MKNLQNPRDAKYKAKTEKSASKKSGSIPAGVPFVGNPKKDARDRKQPREK